MTSGTIFFSTLGKSLRLSGGSAKSVTTCKQERSFAMMRWIAPIAPLGSASLSVTDFESIPP